jgi:hypothetical protein
MNFRFALATVLAAAALAAAVPAASQRTAPAILHVSAEVRPSALLRLEARPASVAVTDADIARGYVEVPAAALLSLETGRIRPTVTAEVAPEAGPFRSVEVVTVNGRSAAGGPPAPAAAGKTGVITAALAYRFTFSDKAAPGSYQVPVTLSISL